MTENEIARPLRARRVAIAGTCALVVLGLTVTAFAARSGDGQRRVSVLGSANTTTPATTETSTLVDELAPDTTNAPVAPDAAPGATCVACPVSTTPVQAAQPAQASDFTGSLTHYRETCGPCPSTGFEKGIEIIIRNNTDHPIDLSTSAPVRVAVVCATKMTADGRLTAPLPAFSPGLFLDHAKDPHWGASESYKTPGTSLAPGAQATNSSSYGYGGEGVDPGNATCEAALVATSDGTWKPETLSVVARITNIPTYSFQVVVPAPTTTSPQTTTTAPASTSTSV